MSNKITILNAKSRYHDFNKRTLGLTESDKYALSSNMVLKNVLRNFEICSVGVKNDELYVKINNSSLSLTDFANVLMGGCKEKKAQVLGKGVSLGKNILIILSDYLRTNRYGFISEDPKKTQYKLEQLKLLVDHPYNNSQPALVGNTDDEYDNTRLVVPPDYIAPDIPDNYVPFYNDSSISSIPPQRPVPDIPNNIMLSKENINLFKDFNQLSYHDLSILFSDSALKRTIKYVKQRAFDLKAINFMNAVIANDNNFISKNATIDDIFDKEAVLCGISKKSRRILVNLLKSYKLDASVQKTKDKYKEKLILLCGLLSDEYKNRVRKDMQHPSFGYSIDVENKFSLGTIGTEQFVGFKNRVSQYLPDADKLEKMSEFDIISLCHYLIDIPSSSSYDSMFYVLSNFSWHKEGIFTLDDKKKLSEILGYSYIDFNSSHINLINPFKIRAQLIKLKELCSTNEVRDSSSVSNVDDSDVENQKELMQLSFSDLNTVAKFTLKIQDFVKHSLRDFDHLQNDKQLKNCLEHIVQECANENNDEKLTGYIKYLTDWQNPPEQVLGDVATFYQKDMVVSNRSKAILKHLFSGNISSDPAKNIIKLKYLYNVISKDVSSVMGSNWSTSLKSLDIEDSVHTNVKSLIELLPIDWSKQMLDDVQKSTNPYQAAKLYDYLCGIGSLSVYKQRNILVDYPTKTFQNLQNAVADKYLDILYKYKDDKLLLAEAKKQILVKLLKEVSDTDSTQISFDSKSCYMPFPSDDADNSSSSSSQEEGLVLPLNNEQQKALAECIRDKLQSAKKTNKLPDKQELIRAAVKFIEDQKHIEGESLSEKLAGELEEYFKNLLNADTDNIFKKTFGDDGYGTICGVLNCTTALIDLSVEGEGAKFNVLPSIYGLSSPAFSEAEQGMLSNSSDEYDMDNFIKNWNDYNSYNVNHSSTVLNPEFSKMAQFLEKDQNNNELNQIREKFKELQEAHMNLVRQRQIQNSNQNQTDESVEISKLNQQIEDLKVQLNHAIFPLQLQQLVNELTQLQNTDGHNQQYINALLENIHNWKAYCEQMNSRGLITDEEYRAERDNLYALNNDLMLQIRYLQSFLQSNPQHGATGNSTLPSSQIHAPYLQPSFSNTVVVSSSQDNPQNRASGDFLSERVKEFGDEIQQLGGIADNKAGNTVGQRISNLQKQIATNIQKCESGTLNKVKNFITENSNDGIYVVTRNKKIANNLTWKDFIGTHVIITADNMLAFIKHPVGNQCEVVKIGINDQNTFTTEDLKNPSEIANKLSASASDHYNIANKNSLFAKGLVCRYNEARQKYKKINRSQSVRNFSIPTTTTTMSSMSTAPIAITTTTTTTTATTTTITTPATTKVSNQKISW